MHHFIACSFLVALLLVVGGARLPADGKERPAERPQGSGQHTSLERGRALMRQAVRVAGRQFSMGAPSAASQASSLYRQAIPFLLQGARENPQDPTAIGSLAVAYAGASDSGRELAILEVGVVKFPENSNLVLMLGTVQLKQGDLLQASRTASYLERLDPNKASVLKMMIVKKRSS